MSDLKEVAVNAPAQTKVESILDAINQQVGEFQYLVSEILQARIKSVEYIADRINPDEASRLNRPSESVSNKGMPTDMDGLDLYRQDVSGLTGELVNLRDKIYNLNSDLRFGLNRIDEIAYLLTKQI